MDVLLGNMRQEILREQSFLIPLFKGIYPNAALFDIHQRYILPATKVAKRNPENLVLERCQQSIFCWTNGLFSGDYWNDVLTFKMGPLITRYRSRPIITPLLGVRVITPVTCLSKTALLQGSHFTPFFTRVGAVAGGISHTKWPKAYSGCATTMKSERVPP